MERASLPFLPFGIAHRSANKQEQQPVAITAPPQNKKPFMSQCLVVTLRAPALPSRPDQVLLPAVSGSALFCAETAQPRNGKIIRECGCQCHIGEANAFASGVLISPESLRAALVSNDGTG